MSARRGNIDGSASTQSRLGPLSACRQPKFTGRKGMTIVATLVTFVVLVSFHGFFTNLVKVPTPDDRFHNRRLLSMKMDLDALESAEQHRQLPVSDSSIPGSTNMKADLVAENESPVLIVQLPSFIEDNVADVDSPLMPPQMETPLFWHVPKAGGTAIQHLYWCMGLTLANEVGANPKFKRHDKHAIEAFQPWKKLPNRVVNVDTTTKKGLMRAASMHLLGTHDENIDYTNVENFSKDTVPETELVLSGELQLSVDLLYSPQHKARVFGLFRHPVHRAASMFYYLQKATWEPTYNPAYKKMTLAQYAMTTGGENNYVVRKLVDKTYRDTICDEDLEKAKRIVKEKIIVGIMDEFEESVHRFNAVMGIDASNPENLACFDKYAAAEHEATKQERQDANREFAKDQRQNAAKELRATNIPDGRNSNSHPEVSVKSPAWNSIVKNNLYDVRLYQYVRALFDEQKALFEPGGVYYGGGEVVMGVETNI
mmetsp:Transcript_21194/g.44389  ORF Transcript_21194/g.44389 Transcript_21194/m.44389 type:complete len:484 (-) Transcript_21194:133-1584(-)